MSGLETDGKIPLNARTRADLYAAEARAEAAERERDALRAELRFREEDLANALQNVRVEQRQNLALRQEVREWIKQAGATAAVIDALRERVRVMTGAIQAHLALTDGIDWIESEWAMHAALASQATSTEEETR